MSEENKNERKKKFDDAIFLSEVLKERKEGKNVNENNKNQKTEKKQKKKKIRITGQIKVKRVHSSLWSRICFVCFCLFF